MRLLAASSRRVDETAAGAARAGAEATWRSAVGRLTPDMMALLLGNTATGTDGEPADARRRVESQPDDRRIDRRLRLAQRHRRRRADRSPRAGVPDARPRRRANSSALLRWPRTTSRRRRSAARTGFESVWNSVAEKLLTSYSDEPFVSDAYGTRAVERADAGASTVEGVSDDPPERDQPPGCAPSPRPRCATLDLTLLLDLLRIEEDDGALARR